MSKMYKTGKVRVCLGFLLIQTGFSITNTQWSPSQAWNRYIQADSNISYGAKLGYVTALVVVCSPWVFL